MTIELTPEGLDKVTRFIKECEAKRKEILDAHKDTADETEIPTVDEIADDILFQGLDDDGDYCNYWGVTDNYDSDTPIFLSVNVDFFIHHWNNF